MEVQARASDVEGSIVNVDTIRFVAAAYRDGRKAAAVTAFMGGMSRTGYEISFHLSDDGSTNTSNGSFYVRMTRGNSHSKVCSAATGAHRKNWWARKRSRSRYGRPFSIL